MDADVVEPPVTPLPTTPDILPWISDSFLVFTKFVVVVGLASAAFLARQFFSPWQNCACSPPPLSAWLASPLPDESSPRLDLKLEPNGPLCGILEAAVEGLMSLVLPIAPQPDALKP